MAGAILVTEGCDGFREEFDPAAGGGQRMRDGVTAKGLEYELLFLNLIFEAELFAAPEFLEWRQRHTGPGRVLPRRLVKGFDPGHLVPALRERRRLAEPLCKRREDLVIAPRFPQRLGGLAHRRNETVCPAHGEVVALQGDGTGKNDVGMPGGGGPERVTDDDGLRTGPGAPQPVEVLVMVERVAPGPQDDPDVRILQPRAVVVEYAPGFSSISAMRDTGM